MTSGCKKLLEQIEETSAKHNAPAPIQSMIGVDNFATVTEDLNHNGTNDVGEFSILNLINGTGPVTQADLVL